MENTIKKLERQSLSQQIYIELKNAIIDMALEPGERINDAELAKKFGVSRTPVREALKRLEDDGLVESIPGSMTRVTHISDEEAKNAFTVVAVLHALAARLAIERMTNQDLQDMRRFNQQLERAIAAVDASAAVQSDAAFHGVILNRCENPELLNVLARITPKITRLEKARFLAKGTESINQHAAIIDACAGKNQALAASLIETNWLTLSEWSMR